MVLQLNNISIEEYGAYQIIEIPGMEELSDDEQQRQLPAIREALFALNDAKRRAVEFSNNLAKIDAALERVRDGSFRRRSSSASTFATPIVDWEEEERLRIIRGREEEEEAHAALLKAGCPPCYPLELGFPLELDHVPEPYKPMIEYWSLGPPTTDRPLCAQLQDWINIQERQKKVQDGSDTRGEPQQRLEEWTAYQSHHQKFQEKLLLRAKEDNEYYQQSLGSLREDVELYTLECSEQRSHRHEALLRWIGNHLDSLQREVASVHLREGSEATVPKVCHSRLRKRKFDEQDGLQIISESLPKKLKTVRRPILRRSERIRKQPDRFVPV